jgi:hypothetical protein
MVKSAERRSTHYDKKLDGSVWNFRITAEKDFMSTQVDEAYGVQFLIESKVKDYLEGIGFFGLEQHHYMNYAQGLWARSRSFTGVTLVKEAGIWADVWLRRGLDPTHLVAVARLLGITLVI